MKKIATLLVSGILALSATACTTAKTSADAPNTTDNVGVAPATTTAQENQADATSQVRKEQLEADIRAREQRNDVTGGDTDRADGDLESEVRSKLEANLPASQLTVEAKEGAVTVSGTVPTQEQFDKIDALAREIKGVQNVSLNVEVSPAKPEG